MADFRRITVRYLWFGDHFVHGAGGLGLWVVRRPARTPVRQQDRAEGQQQRFAGQRYQGQRAQREQRAARHERSAHHVFQDIVLFSCRDKIA